MSLKRKIARLNKIVGGSIRSEPKLVLFILKHLLEFLCTHWSMTFQKNKLKLANQLA